MKDVFIENGEHFAVTPLGKVRFVIKSNIQSGNIDLFFGDSPFPIPTRLLKNAEGVTYLFTIFQGNEMPDRAWELGIEGLIEELKNLRNKF